MEKLEKVLNIMQDFTVEDLVADALLDPSPRADRAARVGGAPVGAGRGAPLPAVPPGAGEQGCHPETPKRRQGMRPYESGVVFVDEKAGRNF